MHESGEVRHDMKAHTLRIARLELCSAWLVGPMPSWIYIHWPGNLFPGASSFTLRIGRAMLGFRWYHSST